MTKKKSKEPEQMMDFILGSVDTEAMELAAMIRPLPANIAPSAQFLDSFRAQLLSVSAAQGNRRAA